MGKSIARRLLIPLLLIVYAVTMPFIWSRYLNHFDPIPLTLYLNPRADLTLSGFFRVKESGIYGLEIELNNNGQRKQIECLLGVADISKVINGGQGRCPSDYQYQSLTVSLIHGSERNDCPPPPLAEGYTADYIARPICAFHLSTGEEYAVEVNAPAPSDEWRSANPRVRVSVGDRKFYEDHFLGSTLSFISSLLAFVTGVAWIIFIVIRIIIFKKRTS